MHRAHRPPMCTVAEVAAPVLRSRTRLQLSHRPPCREPTSSTRLARAPPCPADCAQCSSRHIDPWIARPAAHFAQRPTRRDLWWQSRPWLGRAHQLHEPCREEHLLPWDAFAASAERAAQRMSGRGWLAGCGRGGDERASLEKVVCRDIARTHTQSRPHHQQRREPRRRQPARRRPLRGRRPKGCAPTGREACAPEVV